jgi:hypothetical protein
MYSHLSMEREPTTNDCKPQGTHKNPGLVSRINELKLMEGDLLKGEHYGISHQSTRGTNKYLHDFVEIGRVFVLIHTWVIMEESFNPLGVSLGAGLESR